MKLVIAVLAAAVGIGPAQATDMIKAGKWEFAAQVQVPKLPKLPPGIALPPGINIGSGGINVTRTTCLSASRSVPDAIRAPTEKKGDCKVDRLDQDGATVRWETTCKTPDATVHARGEAHYAGDRMEAMIKTTVVNAGGPPNETAQHITGRYLGPCDAK